MPEGARARSESLTRLAQTALQSGEIETAVGLFEQATLIDGRNVRPPWAWAMPCSPPGATSTPARRSSARWQSSPTCRRPITAMRGR